MTRTKARQAVLGLTLLVAAAAPLNQAAASDLDLRLDVPLVAPLGYTSDVGLGLLTGLQYRVWSGLGLGLTAGAIHLVEQGESTGWLVPVMASVSYTFSGWIEDVEPFVEAGIGYSRAHGIDGSSNWLSAMAGGGLLIRVGDNTKLDLAVDLVSPNLRGGRDDPLALMVRVGVAYELL